MWENEIHGKTAGRAPRALSLLVCLLCVAAARVCPGEEPPGQVPAESSPTHSFGLGTWRPDRSWLRRFHLYDWRANLQFGVDWNRQNSSTGDGTDVSSDNLNFREQIGIGTSGSVFHPSLFEFSTDVVLSFNQNHSSSPGADTSLDTRLIGFNVGANVLRTQPYSLWLFANRGENVVSREFGSRTTLLAENYGSTLRLLVPFRSEVGFRHERLQQEETLIDTPSQDEERWVAFLHSSRQGELSDIDGSYDFQDVIDHAQPDLSFRSHSVNASHRYSFGDYLEKELDSTAQGFSREGDVNLQALGVTERLTINHSDTLSSNYDYGFDFNEDDQFRETRHRAGFDVDHRLFGSLHNRLGLTGSYWEPESGRITEYVSTGSTDYAKRIPGGGAFSLGGTVSYGSTDQGLRGGDFQVFGETHVITGFGPVFLDNPLVAPDSIGVSDTAGTTLYREGFDYRVTSFGDRVALERLPGGRIDNGATIVVDYVFLSTGTLKYDTLGHSVRVGVEYPWISLFFRRFDSDNHLREGDGAFLDDITDQVTGIALRWSTPRLDASMDAEYRWYESSTLDYAGPRVLESVVGRLLDRLSVNATFAQTFSKYSVPENRDTAELSARVTSSWRPLNSLDVELTAGWLRIDDSTVPSETVIDGGLRLQWEIGRMRISPQLSVAHREIGRSSTDGIQATLWVSRQIL